MERLLSQALARAPEERDGFLDAACDGDAAARAELASLLAAHEGTGPFDRLGAMVGPLAAGLRPSDDAAFSALAAGTTLGGRYRIGRELGRGGMATVYLAEDLRYRRPVALKLLRPELSGAGDGGTRFLREIEVASRLTHPHIVPLFDSGEADGRLFYVMPYLEGESLRARLDHTGQLPLDEALEVAQQVAAALGYAHARGIVHRDLKPENVLLHEGQALVADFGIALALEHAAAPRGAGPARLTGTGLIIGTPQYMSPEQALGEPVDARADQYSLACVLHEMLAGEPPFTGATPHALLAKRLVGPAPSVRRRRAEVPAAVDVALGRALTRDVADRFASVTEFAAALRAPLSARAVGDMWAAGVATRGADGHPVPSVVVLPFRTLAAGPADEYIADGLTEDVIAHLAKIRALRVTARSSVQSYTDHERDLREIAEELGATVILDGSVRRAGDRIRVVAQLVDPVTDRRLWAETYDRHLTDIFEIQTDVALRIATALRAELSTDEQARVRREPTKDVHAYQLLMQGRQWLSEFTAERMAHAIGCFERAVARDPAFALAYASLAWVHIEVAESGAEEPEDAWRRATEAVKRARELDPELAAVYRVSGYLKTVREFDWEGAEDDLRRAIELSPSDADAYDAYGRLCAALGRYDDAVRLMRRANELDPLTHRLDVITALLRAARFDEAVVLAEAAVELSPDYDRAMATLGWAYFLSGRRDEGIAWLERAVAASPGSTLWLGQLGAAYGRAGQSGKAREVLGSLEERATRQFVSPYHLAYVHTGLGDADAAITLLERAVAARTGAVYGIKGSFLFTPLHAEPRFQALLRRMRLA